MTEDMVNQFMSPKKETVMFAKIVEKCVAFGFKKKRLLIVTSDCIYQFTKTSLTKT